jgi:HK97 family phage portal protein
MGIFSRFNTQAPQKQESSILAQYAPQLMSENYNLYNYGVLGIRREEAMSIASLARCRNLIAGTIASIPLELYRKSTGEELGSPVWLEQPSKSQPRSVTIAWTVDSLLFYGVAYWKVTELYADDGRPARFEWVANTRVTFDLNIENEYVTQYYVDGYAVPMEGLGSLITFQAFDEGVLARGKELIRAAADLNKAASIAAATPMPSGVLKNNGADLDPKEVQGLLAAWKSARNNRATAYLTSTLEYQATSFSPKEMMYDESKQFFATEIARMMNVPAIYVSADMNSSYTYTNVLDSRKDFVAYSLQPFISAIEDRLSLDDVTAHGNEIRFDLDKQFLRQDPLQELLVIEKLLSLGLITLEQAMEMTDQTPNGNGGM